MAKKSNTAKRNAYLKATNNGDPAVPPRKKTKAARITTYADNAKIVVVKPYEAREGTHTANVWELVRKSKTIAQYRANRKRAKMGDNLGGMLSGFVNAGHVRITVK